MNEQTVLTASSVDSWNYGIPRSTDAKLVLLTVGGVAVIGNWYGKYGQYFTAWAPLLKTDKVIERYLATLTLEEKAEIVSITRASGTNEVIVRYAAGAIKLSVNE